HVGLQLVLFLTKRLSERSKLLNERFAAGGEIIALGLRERLNGVASLRELGGNGSAQPLGSVSLSSGQTVALSGQSLVKIVEHLPVTGIQRRFEIGRQLANAPSNAHDMSKNQPAQDDNNGEIEEKEYRRQIHVTRYEIGWKRFANAAEVDPLTSKWRANEGGISGFKGAKATQQI
ncbi:MAG TPA: hypothetical protein VM532_01645, partial [Burkholderiales bacterium]|nr:hypothetical protein [Burkholderiales bacterium]